MSVPLGDLGLPLPSVAPPPVQGGLRSIPPHRAGLERRGTLVPGFPQRRNVATTAALSLTLSPKRGLSLCFFMTDGRRNDQMNEERAATVNQK